MDVCSDAAMDAHNKKSSTENYFAPNGAPRFPEPLLAYFAIEMLRGLEAMHSAGVVHMDVSPRHFFVKFAALPKGEWAPHRPHGWQQLGLQLGHFASSVDVAQYVDIGVGGWPKGQTGHVAALAATGAFTGFSVPHGAANATAIGAWLSACEAAGCPRGSAVFEGDVFGVVSTVFALLCGGCSDSETMELHPRPQLLAATTSSAASSKAADKLLTIAEANWALPQETKRVWARVIDTLLNIPSLALISATPQQQHFRSQQEAAAASFRVYQRQHLEALAAARGMLEKRLADDAETVTQLNTFFLRHRAVANKKKPSRFGTKA